MTRKVTKVTQKISAKNQGLKDGETTRPVGAAVSVGRLAALLLMRNSVGTQARDALVRGRLNRDIDMNYECRWPEKIEPANYTTLFGRNAVAGRVVDLWPSECWIQPPTVYEDEEAETESEFEKAWKALEERLNLLTYLSKIDVLSGIGRYGVLFLGLDDLGPGQDFSTPVEGLSMDEDGFIVPAETSSKRKLLYLRALPETSATIEEWEKEKGSARYGKPILYSVQMEDPKSGQGTTTKVHWTRIIHIADNCLSSEILGIPRMQPVYDDLLDLRKLKGGASEGYWRACLSGTAWTLDKDLVDAMTTLTGDMKDDLKDELEDYYNSMQRDIVAEGYIPHDVSPKLVDPSPFAAVLIKLICIRLGVPYSIFIGEENRLEGRQMRSSWLERVKGRQMNYVTPFVVLRTIIYLQALGILPATEEIPKVKWPERDSPTEADIAKTAESTTRALALYTSSGVNALMGEREYFGQVFKKTADEIKAISKEVEDWEETNNPPEDDANEDGLRSEDSEDNRGEIN